MTTNYRSAWKWFVLGLHFMTTTALASASLAADGKSGNKSEYEQALSHYLSIQKKLASDTLEGVAAEAQAMVKKLDRVKSQDTSRIKPPLAALSKATDIEDARTHFKSISQAIVDWTLTAHPAGIEGVSAKTCPMAKSVWLQEKGEVRNPFYGKKMLKCGSPYSGDNRQSPPSAKGN